MRSDDIDPRAIARRPKGNRIIQIPGSYQEHSPRMMSNSIVVEIDARARESVRTWSDSRFRSDSQGAGAVEQHYTSGTRKISPMGAHSRQLVLDVLI